MLLQKEFILKAVLESVSFVALKVFQTNKLIVNPGKFQSIRVRKMKQCCAEKIIRTGEKFIDDLS